MKRSNLIRVIPWAHRLVSEVLREGDLAVDLTAGNGHDTLMLAECVGSTGQVIAFDVQRAAIARTAERLESAGITCRRIDEPGPIETDERVGLVQDSHAGLAAYLPRAPQAFIANLGYLPGSDRTVVTRPDTTLAAIQAALKALKAGGRLAAVVYVGHDGAVAEAEAVDSLFRELPRERWQVLDLRSANRPHAPYLLVAQKSR